MERQKVTSLSLLFLVIILGTFVLSPPVYVSASPGWLDGWDKRVEISIDHNDIDIILSDFPVLIYLSGTDAGINDEDVSFIFDEVGANSLKVALTTSDGETECYVEVAKWDVGNELAWLWAKIPSVDNSTDTDLYFYYDNDHADNTAHVGLPNSLAAENVWDGHFKFVSHMRDDPDTSHIRDSTSFDNDGTKKGANEPIVTTGGRVGDAQDFDGSNDYVNVTDADSIDFTAVTPFTLEAWVKLTDKGLVGADNYQYIFAKGTSTRYEFYFQFDGYLRLLIKCSDAVQIYLTDDVDLRDNAWHYVVGIRSVPADAIYLLVDGQIAIAPLADTTTGTFANAENLRVGCTSSGVRFLNGLGDEMRISSVSRTGEWVKASYETGRDHLLDFGSEQEAFLVELTQSLSTSWSVETEWAATVDLTQSISSTWNVLNTWDATVALTQAISTTWEVAVDFWGAITYSYSALLPIMCGAFALIGFGMWKRRH